LKETLPKEKILGNFIDEIFLAKNSYGVTRPRDLFHKTLGELPALEAAFLDGPCPKAPSDYLLSAKRALLSPSELVFHAYEMKENGYITASAYSSGSATAPAVGAEWLFRSFRQKLAAA